MQDEVTVTQAALNNRSPLHRAVYKAIRNFNMGNMCDEDGYPYPLVDLMSNPAPADISTGEDQMIDLTDEIVEAIQAERETLARMDPVAWLYTSENGKKRVTSAERWEPHNVTYIGATEVALYALPPAPEAGQ